MTFRSKTVLTAALFGVVGALLAVPAGEAQATTALPFGTPSVRSLGITGQVQDMVLAGDKIWISTDNELDVFSTAGKKLTTVPQLLGVNGLVPSADGSRVYAALSQDSRIVTLDATTMSQTQSWTTSPCPTHLALAAGRLFYSYGCSTPAGAIGSVSLADGSAGPVVADSLYSPPQLRGAGDTLIAADQSGSPTAMDSYLAAADGTATKQASMRTGEGYDFALSPDGAQLIVTGYDSGYSIERFNSADFSAAGVFSMGPYPQAVAYSADGSTFAGALSTSYDDMIRVFDAKSGSLTSHSAVVSGSVSPSVLAGTLHFSADGTLLYGIASVDGIQRLITVTAQTVSAARLTAVVASPTVYGKAAAVRISAPGRPGTRVTVAVPSTGGTRILAGITDAAGSVLIHAVSPYSGPVTITLAGDLRHPVKTLVKAMKVPAKLSIKPIGFYSSKGGMRHYRKISDVHILTQAFPKRQMKLNVVMQAKVGNHWRTSFVGAYTTASDGAGYLYLTAANKHLPYRLLLSFAGDATNAKAPTVVSPTFIIG